MGTYISWTEPQRCLTGELLSSKRKLNNLGGEVLDVAIKKKHTEKKHTEWSTSWNSLYFRATMPFNSLCGSGGSKPANKIMVFKK